MKNTTTTKQLSVGTLVRRGDEHLVITHAEPTPRDKRRDYHGAKMTYTLWSGRQNKFFTLLVGPRYSYFLPAQ